LPHRRTRRFPGFRESASWEAFDTISDGPADRDLPKSGHPAGSTQATAPQAPDPELAAIRRRLRQVFYDIGDDGVVIYQDPAIGRYEHPLLGVSLRISSDHQVFELHVGGRVVESFPIGRRAEEACGPASHAYFVTVASLARRRRYEEMCRQAGRPALRLVS